MLPHGVLGKSKNGKSKNHMRAPPHSLHRLYLPPFHLSTNGCVYDIAYLYTPHSRVPQHNPPPTHTHIPLVALSPTRTRCTNESHTDITGEGMRTNTSTVCRGKGPWRIPIWIPHLCRQPQRSAFLERGEPG